MTTPHDLLLQDESKGLSQYLTNAPHAHLHATEAARAITQPVPESAEECEFGDEEYQWRLWQAGF